MWYKNCNTENKKDGIFKSHNCQLIDELMEVNSCFLCKV